MFLYHLRDDRVDDSGAHHATAFRACSRRAWPQLPRTGVACGGVLFWLMHAAAASVFVNAFAATWLTLPTFLAGLAWGWMRQRFGSLWPAFLTHLAADVAILRMATTLVQN